MAAELAKPLGVRTMVQAGRGYSFSVATDQPAEFPIYFPARRVACTPYQGRLRDRRNNGVPRPGRTAADRTDRRHPGLGAAAVHQHGSGAPRGHLGGARPVTPDGLPLVGATRSPGVYVAGGHGMWGIVLGPATGKLLAEQIATGRMPDEIRPFDPLR